MSEPKLFFLLVCCCLVPGMVFAQGAKNQSRASIILTTEGEACLGQEHSREQTIKLAHAEAKRIATEHAKTHVTSESSVIDGKLLDDLIASYAKASVRVIEELEKQWFQTSPDTGFVDSCYRVKLKLEVIPSPFEHKSDGKPESSLMSPRVPLSVELWTDKDVYHIGDTMTFFFRGNKPFYAHAVYRDAQANLIEVTPHERTRYYKGGVIYQIPDADDSFTLKITPPVGNEQLILYASTQPMGSYAGQAAGDLLVINKPAKPMDVTTRGLTVLQGKQVGGEEPKSEFAEVKAAVRVEN
jgi:NOL1/NOP2/fmu family ribosome biogenesis protein